MDALLFLNNNIEALAALPSGWGSLAIELVKRLLDGMPTILFWKLSQIKLLVVFIQLINQTRSNPSKKLALSLTQCLMGTLYI